MKNSKAFSKASVRRIAAAAAALLLAAAFTFPAGTNMSVPRLGNAIVASALTYGDFEYSVNGDNTTVTITQYNGLGGDVEIPSEIDGKPVTAIGNLAFYNCTNLTSITIPDNVTSIGTSAFYKCSSLTSINIPDNVTSIGNAAFYNCSNLTSINIPDGVASIGNKTFANCSSLISINIPDSVNSIGEDAFLYCKSLASITIPNNVNSIGNYAFESCRNLASITIPNSVTSIGNDAFNGCTSLTSIFLPNTLNVSSAGIPTSATQIKYTVSDGKVTITGATLGTAQTAVVIPEKIGGKDVTAIGDWAFANCDSLTSITIPDSVTSIGDDAFNSCDSLTSITIPDGVESIGNGAFLNCINLTSITIPDSVESIGDRAFYVCSNLKSVFLPEGLSSASIGTDAIPDTTAQVRYTVVDDGIISITEVNLNDQTSVDFPDNIGGKTVTAIFIEDGTTGVDIPASATQIKYTVSDGKVTITGVTLGTGQTSVDFPEKIDGKDVTAIADSAFFGCTSLESIKIPKSVSSVGGYAFGTCSSITVDENSPYYSSADGVLFDKNKTKLIRYPLNKSGDSYVIPDSVVSIEASAFAGCRNLTSITIPDGVTSIGDDAFFNCKNLTSITIPDSVITIGDNAFINCTSLTSITIPNSVTSIGDFAFDYFTGDTSLKTIFLPEGLDVSRASIPDTAAQIIYTVDNDGNAAITKIDLGRNQTEVDIPEKIGDYPVISVAEEYQQYVGEHTHTGGTASCTEKAVCDICGQEYDNVLGHAYGEPVFSWAEDNSCKAVFTCANDSTHVEEISCEVSITASTDAVCETGGSVTYTAKVTFENTEYTDEKTVNVPAKGHTIVKVEMTEPTCTKDGNTLHYKCSVCGKLFSDSEGNAPITAEGIVISAKGHDFEDGKCTVCGEVDPEYSEPVEPEPTPDPEPTTPEENKADEAAKDVENKLADIKVSNDTAAEDILEEIRKTVDKDIDVSVCEIVTVPATEDCEGKLTVTVRISDKKGNVLYVTEELVIARLPKAETKPAAVYYSVITSGNVSADRSSAAAGQTVSVKAGFGYDIVVTDESGRRIAKINQKGSFIMPDSKVVITAVQNDTFGLMSNAYSHSYVYCYDSDMNRIKVSSNSKRGVIVIDLGSEHAGCEFTVYSGRKSTKTEIISGTLDKNGKFTFNAETGKNYTLVVE